MCACLMCCGAQVCITTITGCGTPRTVIVARLCKSCVPRSVLPAPRPPLPLQPIDHPARPILETSLPQPSTSLPRAGPPPLPQPNDYPTSPSLTGSPTSAHRPPRPALPALEASEASKAGSLFSQVRFVREVSTRFPQGYPQSNPSCEEEFPRTVQISTGLIVKFLITGEKRGEWGERRGEILLSAVENYQALFSRGLKPWAA